MKDAGLNTQLSFRVDDETAQKLKDIATANKRKMADAIRLLFMRSIDKFDVKKDRL